jgi:HAD superfamily hydrolase (TIGR01509 family)
LISNKELEVMPDADDLLAILDHDGVLVDSFEFHEQAWMELERRTKLGFTPEFIHSTFGMTNPSIFRKLLGEKLSDEEVRHYAALKEECYRDVARGRIQLLEGMRPLLDALTDRGVKLAIGSSGPLANLELSISDCGLEGRFAAIASLEDITRGKPDPQVFLVAAAKAGAHPARSAVFEDATVGIQAAKAAGMYAVGLTTTHPAAALAGSGADLVVESLIGFDVDRLVTRLRTSPLIPGIVSHR